MALITFDSTQVLAAAVVLVTALIAWEFLFSPLRHIPGPFLCRFSEAWRAYLTTKGDVEVKNREWHAKWGAAVRVGPNVVSLNDPDLIRVIYTTKGAWRKSTMYRPNDLLVDGQRVQNIFNTQDKDFHAKYTKPIAGFWSLTKILEMEPLMDESLKKFTDKLADKFVDGANAGKTAMMDVWLTYHSWDAAANISFGQDYGFVAEGKDVGNIIAESTAGLKYFAPVSQFPWIDNWLDKSPIYRLGPRPLVNGFIYTVNMFGQYQKSLAEGTLPHKDIDHFLDKYNGLKDQYDFVDDNQLINWIMLNVLAGGDSSAGAMRPVLYHLAKNLSKYAKLVKELEEAALPMPAQWKHLSKLPYLDAVMKESMRISPSVGLMLEREVPDGGFELPDGRYIPAGVKVGLNPTVVTRDVGVFGKDVDDFNPDRWLQRPGESDDEFSTRTMRMREVTNLMFGAGNRVCMGQWMAKVGMYKLMATLYTMFDIKLVDPNHEWTEFNAWFMYQTDMPMKITRRR